MKEDRKRRIDIGDNMQVRIEKLDTFGRGIAHINNKICFVENALPNELVDIKIIKEKTKYCEAKVINYIETSKDRIEVDCPYYEKCGGCNLRHLKYEKENEFKQQKVEELLKHIGNINIKVNNIIYGNEYNYRNKVTFHKSKNKKSNYEKNTRNIISIEKCLLLDNKINDLIGNIDDSSNEIVIRTSNDSKDIILNNNKQIITNIGNKKYYLSRNSFFQVNKYLTKDLFNLIRKSIMKKYNKCLDLYCGTGTIGIYISNLVNNIIGIDYNESNISDANKNKKLNNINNISFICDKVENKINEFNDIDLIIVDPPRAGLDNKTKEYLIKINPELIIYVSCDPVTLSRDLKDLSNSYAIKEVTPVNMFPRTYHCESVTILEKRINYE